MVESIGRFHDCTIKQLDDSTIQQLNDCTITQLHNSKLYRIHKRLFHPVEDDNPHKQQNHHKPGAVGQMPPAEGSGTEHGIPETLHNRGHGIGHDQGLVLFRDGGNGIDHRRGIHQQLHPELDQKGQVAVLAGERGEDDPEAKSQAGHQQHVNRDQQHVDVRMDAGIGKQHEIGKDGQKEPELDAELDQPGGHLRQGHDQAREIDLAKDAGIFGEGLGCSVETLREIVPDHDAGKIE